MQSQPTRFSNKERTERLQQSQNKHYDLIVIGGGITGAGIIFDAALRGLSVLLLEKGDFASGTSSKSTKLIHGGLRYLKQLEFSLVRESGLERAVAHRNACHLVHPRSMILPIVNNGTFSQFTAGMAIKVYDWLAAVEPSQRRKKLNKQQVEKIEPLLNPRILKSGIQYSEYRTDDARLTIEIIKSARAQGGEAYNYTEVTGFDYKDKKVSGVQGKDLLTGEPLSFSATAIINSTGPWVDTLRQEDNASTVSSLHPTKGVHIVIDKKTLNINNSIYFDAFDGRMIFAIPRGQAVYVGTTDTTYTDNPDDVRCLQADAEYLLKALNNMFDLPTLTMKDIKSTWAGLRPLIKKAGKGPTELSRKDEIFVSDSGLISIAGGKLTGFRKMAERVLDLVQDATDLPNAECITEDKKIHHNPFSDYKEYQNLITTLDEKHPEIDKHELSFLVSTYGKDALLILANAASDYNGDILKSQVQYCLEFESLASPMDFLERRTGWLYFDIVKAEKAVKEVTEQMAKELGQDQQWISENIAACENVIAVNGLKEFKDKTS